MFAARTYPVEVVEFKCVEEILDSIFTAEQKDQLIDWIAMNPGAGECIPDTNGVR